MKVWMVVDPDGYPGLVFATRELAEEFVQTEAPIALFHYAGDKNTVNEDGFEVIESLPEPVRGLRLDAELVAGVVRRETEEPIVAYPGLSRALPGLCEESYWYDRAYVPYHSELASDQDRAKSNWTEERLAQTPGASIPVDAVFVRVEGIDIERVRKAYTELRGLCLVDFERIVIQGRG